MIKRILIYACVLLSMGNVHAGRGGAIAGGIIGGAVLGSMLSRPYYYNSPYFYDDYYYSRPYVTERVVYDNNAESEVYTDKNGDEFVIVNNQVRYLK